MLDRRNNDGRYRKSQLAIGCTDEQLEALEMLVSNDYTHHCSKEQRDRYKQTHFLKRNFDGCTRENAQTHTILNSTQQFKKDRGLQSPIPLHLRVSPSRSISRALVFNLPLLIWQEEIPGEMRLGERGVATTASGVLCHLGAKTNGSRRSREVIFCILTRRSATKDGNLPVTHGRRKQYTVHNSTFPASAHSSTRGTNFLAWFKTKASKVSLCA